MNCLGFSHLLTITNYSLFQRKRGFSWRSNQALDKPAGFVGIQLDLVILMDNLQSHFADKRDDKFSH